MSLHPKATVVPFAVHAEGVPVVRREVPTTLWGPQDPGRARGFTAVG